MISESGFLEKIRNIVTWKRHDQRAPHKPLLLILALTRISQGVIELTFADTRLTLNELLREFGPTRSVNHPEYPFLRLKSDGLWDIFPAEFFSKIQSNTDLSAKALLNANAAGKFPADIINLLIKKPEIAYRAIEVILDAHFPESIHSDICNSVGLREGYSRVSRKNRSSGFRQEVLLSYGHACAVCGLSLRLNDKTIGIDAAHIRWFQADGPDSADNGLALCVLHHKLFDLGAFTLADDATILISERVAGGPHLRSSLLSFHGNRINMPSRPEHAPNRDFIAWHRAQVFKERHLPLMAV